MAGIRAAKETYLAENNIQGFLSKEDMVRQQTEFCILAAELETDGKWGDAWKLQIVFIDEDGQHSEQRLYLQDNKYRTWFFTQNLKEYPVHSVKLIEGRNSSNQKFYDMDDCESVPPCPCQTGDMSKRNGKHKIVQEAAEEIVFKQEEESPIVDDVEGYRAHVSNLATAAGWPVPMKKLKTMSKQELKDLEKTISKFKE